MGLVWCYLIGCMEYDIHNTAEKENFGIEEEEPELTDTSEPLVAEPSEEDTGYEEPIDEGIPPALEQMYIHTASLLYSYNEDGEIETIGQFYIDEGYAPSITDLAIDLTGNMYAISNSALYRVDPTDARLEHQCDTDEFLVGLTFLADGRLLAAGDNIYWMQPNSCAKAIFVETEDYQTSGDIVGLPDGNLYWTVVGGDALVRVNGLSGETDFIGNIGSINLWGVGYFNGVLYGFSSEGKIVHIDPNNAQIIDEKTTSGQYWWGAASNPVFWE